MNQILFILGALSKQIVYEFDASNMLTDCKKILYTLVWNVHAQSISYFSNCGQTIFGGTGIFDMRSDIIRHFELPPHYRLYVDISFLRIDSWDSDLVVLDVDEKIIYQKALVYGTGPSICGDSNYDDEIIQIYAQAQHSSNLAIIQINIKQAIADNNESWGLVNFILSIEQCPDGCDLCLSNTNCQQWSLYYWNQQHNAGLAGIQYYLYYYFNLDQIYEYAQALPSHSKVMIRFRLFIQCSNSISVDVLINNQIYTSKALSSSFSFNEMYEVNISFFYHIQNYIHIQIKRTGGTQPKLSIKDFQVFLEDNDALMTPYITGCQTIIKNTCWECLSGWSFDEITEECRQIIILNDFIQTQQTIQIQSEQHCNKGWKFDKILNGCFPDCGDKLINGFEECDDGNDSPFDGCYNCEFSCPQNCSICRFGMCIECEKQFSLDSQNNCQQKCGDGIMVPFVEECEDQNETIVNDCEINQINCQAIRCQSCQMKIIEQNYQICGDQKISKFEECDDGNNQPFDGCYNCQFSCAQNCKLCKFGMCLQCEPQFFMVRQNKCSSIFGDGILVPFIQQCEYPFIECEINKPNCRAAHCLSHQMQTKEQINQICGDKIVSEFEQCDDGNDITYDGCFNCEFSCIQHCKVCTFGVCTSCQDGFKLDNQNDCQPIFGDGVVIPYIEQCDDGNINEGDGCYNCQFESIVKNCIQFNAIQCMQCDIGTQLENNHCFSICGDQIVMPELEDCDDGNDEQYDGCFQCKYSCKVDCQNCIFGTCQDECIPGEIMIQNICQSLCGNNITTGIEECDDGNNLEYDGCYECQYSCPLFCELCYQGICMKCQSNYLLLNDSCQFLNNEGEIFLQADSFCNDNNTLANDGCNQQKIENNWICNTDIPSECSFSTSPIFLLTYLNFAKPLQYVKISFSQQVKVSKNGIFWEEVLVSNIQNVLNNSYQISIFPQSNLTTNLSFSEAILAIEIRENMFAKPILSVGFNCNIVNQYNMSLRVNNSKILLQSPRFLNPEQTQQAQDLLNTNQYIIYTLGAISLLSLLSGDSSIFQEILGTLQYFSLLKFINVQYPENVMIFFQFADMISVQPLLRFINLDYQIQPFDADVTLNGKFAYYQLEPNLYINLICQFLQIFGLLMLFIIFRLCQQLKLRHLVIIKYSVFMDYLAINNHFKIFQPVRRIFFWLASKLVLTTQLLTYEGLQKIIFLNSWDLLFKIFLNLNSCHSKQYDQQLLSFMIGGIFIFLIITQLQRILYFQGKKARKYLIISEITDLIRQIIFLFFLVFLQYNEVLQILLILLNTISYTLLMNFQQTHYLKEKNIILFIIEGTVIVFTFTSISYFQDLYQLFNQEQRILIGFSQIGIMCSALGIQLLVYVISKTKEMKIIYEIKRQNERQQLKHVIFV